MDSSQRRFFAQNGYLVISGALSPRHVASLDELISARVRNEAPPGETFVDGYRKLRVGPCLQPGASRPAFSGGASVPPTQPTEYAPPAGWVDCLRQCGEPADHRSAAAFRQLLELPLIEPILEELLSEPRWGHVPVHVPVDRRAEWRLDHDYCDVKGGFRETGDDTPAGDGELHGTIGAHHITCVFELRDTHDCSGGFACV
eukprot:COSAG05_NODE_8088_length_737_cov_0.793103_2_plen_200_part_01